MRLRGRTRRPRIVAGARAVDGVSEEGGEANLLHSAKHGVVEAEVPRRIDGLSQFLQSRFGRRVISHCEQNGCLHHRRRAHRRAVRICQAKIQILHR